MARGKYKYKFDELAEELVRLYGDYDPDAERECCELHYGRGGREAEVR